MTDRTLDVNAQNAGGTRRASGLLEGVKSALVAGGIAAGSVFALLYLLG